MLQRVLLKQSSGILRQIAIFFAVVSLVVACSKTPPSSDPVRGSKGKSASKAIPLQVTPQPNNQPAPGRTAISTPDDSDPSKETSPASPTSVSKADATSKQISVVAEDCDSSIKFKDDEPIFLPESKAFITRIMSPCLTASGEAGHKKKAGWMAMGFPCTGGEGRIDWKGTNYNRPKMVSFLLETSCAMAPLDTHKLREEAAKTVGISAEAPLIAFNPFAIQYWEVPGYDDADTSFAVDLRSGKGIDDAWVRFIKSKPLKVFLVGRENAWVPGNYMYAAEGDLIWVSKNRFTFKVEKARLLADDEHKKVRGRCEALRPERDCLRVF